MQFKIGTNFRILPLVAMIFVALSVPAQSGNAGAVRGTVADPSGAVSSQCHGSPHIRG